MYIFVEIGLPLTFKILSLWLPLYHLLWTLELWLLAGLIHHLPPLLSQGEASRERSGHFSSWELLRASTGSRAELHPSSLILCVNLVTAEHSDGARRIRRREKPALEQTLSWSFYFSLGWRGEKWNSTRLAHLKFEEKMAELGMTAVILTFDWRMLMALAGSGDEIMVLLVTADS